METGDLHYKELAERVQNYTRDHVGESGIYANFVKPTEDGIESCSNAISFAGCADSYYEYILKVLITTNFEVKIFLVLSSWREKRSRATFLA